MNYLPRFAIGTCNSPDPVVPDRLLTVPSSFHHPGQFTNSIGVYVIQTMGTRPELYKRLVYTEWLFSGIVFLTLLVLPESPRELPSGLRESGIPLTASNLRLTFSLVVKKRQTGSCRKSPQKTEWRNPRVRRRSRAWRNQNGSRRNNLVRGGGGGQKKLLPGSLQGYQFATHLDFVLDLGLAADHWHTGSLRIYRA